MFKKGKTSDLTRALYFISVGSVVKQWVFGWIEWFYLQVITKYRKYFFSQSCEINRWKRLCDCKNFVRKLSEIINTQKRKKDESEI